MTICAPAIAGTAVNDIADTNDSVNKPCAIVPPNGVSLARYPNGASFWQTTLRTRGTVNSSPLTSVIINELMYHPNDPTGTNENTLLEYVELFNPTAAPVLLQDTNGQWQLNGGVEFTFPPNTTIPAGGTLLLVNFGPTDTTASNAPS